MSNVLQFGIPSFDALFGRLHAPAQAGATYPYDSYGIQLTGMKQATSISIIGPDGAGKSVFGLHLAAQYMASADLTDTPANRMRWIPRVLYVSTDLKHHVAEVMWTNFGLCIPNQRDFPFHRAYRRGKTNPDRRVRLARLDPAYIQREVLDDNFDEKETIVHFIDLVSKTMGDDWGFINRLVAVLRTPPKGYDPNLLIIDAVEGFETLVGEKDAFGETTSRRARIAQIMRGAGEKCHVCFIVEEPKTGERFPEEFVTDAVIRLRCVSFNNYSRRTVEILKARGQAHVRGQHYFAIREKLQDDVHESGNADEPNVKNSYVHVFPSLHILSRQEMKSTEPLNDTRKDRVAAFGINYLDEMLTRVRGDEFNCWDNQGLRVQTNTALIGEFATQKTGLAIAFLARTFRAFAFQLADVMRDLNGDSGGSSIRKALEARAYFKGVIQGTPKETAAERTIVKLLETLKKWDAEEFRERIQELGIESAKTLSIDGPMEIARFAAWLTEGLEENGAAVLITTSNQDRDRLVGDLKVWLESSRSKAMAGWPTFERARLPDEFKGPFEIEFANHLKQRTICRRLELHDLSSATLFQIIQRSVERAQEKVFLSDDLEDNEDRLPYVRSKRFKASWNIRVVLDDLSTLKDAYPEIGSDPIFLPFLLSYFEREGVTSLIVDSHMARPDTVVTDALGRELRALASRRILTWQVPFLGQIREAITVVPPDSNGLPSLVREVRCQSTESGAQALVVDPELELYSGLERGEHPIPIPLEMRLYAETAATIEYIREQNEILGQLFTPLGTGPDAKVIIGMECWPYDSLRDFCNLQTCAPLDHTMIFQVDEFWAIDRSLMRITSSQLESQQVSRGRGSLYPLDRYLTAPTSIRTASGRLLLDRTVDPFGAFQGKPIGQHTAGASMVPGQGPWERRHYFTRSAQGQSGDQTHNQPEQTTNRSEPTSDQTLRIDRVPYTWDFGFLLCPTSMWISAREEKIDYQELTVDKVWDDLPKTGSRDQKQYISWRKFLGACKAVAKSRSNQSSELIRALDVSTLAGESFTCIMLEIWASEIYDSLDENDRGRFFRSLGKFEWPCSEPQSLIRWLTKEQYVLAFYRTWLLLLDVVELADLVDRQTIPRLKLREADGKAAATRHWYKTACGHQHCPITNELSIPVRLPGHFSVRGDWFLAVAGGSRSERLACKALDLFSTRRANFRRMELGIGLPTRDIASKASFGSLPTALEKRDEGRTSAVTYGELIGSGIERSDHFSWLWRSQLSDYHRHSRLLQRWIGQVAETWDDLQKKRAPEWLSGFTIYDKLEDKREHDGTSEHLLKWSEFKELCEQLRKQLEIASESAPSSDI